jgi:type III secretion protein U
MSEEKTEQPTSKKLREAREKGQVAHSKDLVSAALTVALFLYFWTTWGDFIERMRELLVFPPQFYRMPFAEATKYSFDIGLEMVKAILVPVILITIITGILANVRMVGVLLAGESIKPSLDKINPAKGIKRIFGMKNLIDVLKSTIKVIFLSVLVVMVVQGAIGELVRAPGCGLPCLEVALADLLTQTMIYVSGAFVVIAAADFAYQKYEHTKELKMSKEEVKREYKESESDPHIKSHRKHLAHELLMHDQVGAVRKASVVVTNPTRIAVALRYTPGDTPLPLVVAKGENLNAARIIEIAREAGVPIMENVPLARALLADAEVDRYIPNALIEPVAEVLRWVRELGRSEG